MSYFSNCGLKLSEGVNFCNDCGKGLISKKNHLMELKLKHLPTYK